MTSGADHLQSVLNELTESRGQLDQLREELARRRVTVRSANKLVSVKVDARGSVVDVQFHSTAYTRMTPDELGRLIAETVGEAQSEMARGVAEKVAPFRGLGDTLRESISGGLRRPGPADR